MAVAAQLLHPAQLILPACLLKAVPVNSKAVPAGTHLAHYMAQLLQISLVAHFAPQHPQLFLQPSTLRAAVLTAAWHTWPGTSPAGAHLALLATEQLQRRSADGRVALLADGVLQARQLLLARIHALVPQGNIVVLLLLCILQPLDVGVQHCKLLPARCWRIRDACRQTTSGMIELHGGASHNLDELHQNRDDTGAVAVGIPEETRATSSCGRSLLCNAPLSAGLLMLAMARGPCIRNATVMSFFSRRNLQMQLHHLGQRESEICLLFGSANILLASWAADNSCSSNLGS